MLFPGAPLFWILVNAERRMVKEGVLTFPERCSSIRWIWHGYLMAERNRREL